MTHRNWIKWFFVYLLLALASIAGLNYIIDPYQQFRISSLYPIHFDGKKQRYLNAGLAKHYDYQSVVLGTSHTRGFSIEEIQNKLDFKKTIKLTMDGASGYEAAKVLQVVLQNHRATHVLYGVDPFAFMVAPSKERGGFPDYLYEDTAVSGISYLVKYNTLLGSLKAVAAPFVEKDKRKFMIQHMYDISLFEGSVYGREFMLQRNNIRYGFSEGRSFEQLKTNFEDTILPLLLTSPEVEYTLFYPPYSIMAYTYYDEVGLLKDYLLFKRYLHKTVNRLDHVKLFDFQIAHEITHNLDNYKDYTHYKQEVATWMLDNIQKNEFYVSEDSVSLYEVQLRRQVENFRVEE